MQLQNKVFINVTWNKHGFYLSRLNASIKEFLKSKVLLLSLGS